MIRSRLEGVPHYSDAADDALLFYGGRFSSFAGWPFSTYPMFIRGQGLVTFRSREHWFAAHKTLDKAAWTKIVEAGTPARAKQLGHDVELIDGWDDGVAFAVMVQGIRYQCAAYSAFAEELVNTGERLIAEDSPSDYIWGIRDADGGWDGQNLLGRALMRVRGELRGP